MRTLKSYLTSGSGPDHPKPEPPVATIDSSADSDPPIANAGTTNQDQMTSACPTNQEYTTKESTQDRHHEEAQEAKKDEGTLLAKDEIERQLEEFIDSIDKEEAPAPTIACPVHEGDPLIVEAPAPILCEARIQESDPDNDQTLSQFIRDQQGIKETQVQEYLPKQ